LTAITVHAPTIEAPTVQAPEPAAAVTAGTVSLVAAGASLVTAAAVRACAAAARVVLVATGHAMEIAAAQIAAVHVAHRPPPLLETVAVGATTYPAPAHHETDSQREVALSGAARVDSPRTHRGEGQIAFTNVL